MEKMGKFIFRQMDEDSAREIVSWQYEAPYDIYNSAPDRIEESVQGYLDPANKYFTIWSTADALIGFRCFGADARVPGGDYGAEALDMGGGLKPDLTGRGLGAGFMEAAMEFAHRHFAPVAFRATVAAFNKRALRVCEKIGYKQASVFVSTHSGKEFVILIKDILQDHN